MNDVNVDDIVAGVIRDSNQPVQTTPTPTQTPEETVSSSAVKPEYTGRNGEFNPWDDFEILPPKELVLTGMSRNNKTFCVSSREELPEAVLTRFKSMLPILADKTYIHNHTGSDFDKLEAVTLSNYFDKRVFVPFKQKDMTFKPHLMQPTEYAYSVAKANTRNMGELSRGLRAVISNRYHIFFGEDLKQPVEFVIIYSSDKATTLKSHRYKEVKGMYDIFKIAEMADIPVINLANEDALDLLKKIIDINHKPAPQQETV